MDGSSARLSSGLKYRPSRFVPLVVVPVTVGNTRPPSCQRDPSRRVFSSAWRARGAPPARPAGCRAGHGREPQAALLPERSQPQVLLLRLAGAVAPEGFYGLPGEL